MLILSWLMIYTDSPTSSGSPTFSPTFSGIRICGYIFEDSSSFQ